MSTAEIERDTETLIDLRGDREIRVRDEPSLTAADPAERLLAIDDLRDHAMSAGDDTVRARRRLAGRLSARERIDALLDDDSFVEIGLLARHHAMGLGVDETRPHTDGVITGWGLVHGRKTFVYAQDFAVLAGTVGEVHGEKLHRLMDLAEAVGAPVVGLNDGAGARIQEGIVALESYGRMFFRNVRASGIVPQISVILGPCAGGAVYSPALTDFIFMVEQTSHMFVTGPDVVRTVTGEDVTLEVLGGAATHATLSGVASATFDDEESCIEAVRYLLSMLPSNNLEVAPHFPPDDDPQRRCGDLVSLLPSSTALPYDIRDVISSIVDDGELFEISARWARNLVCALARLDGHVVGVIANQPLHLAGVLDVDASDKGGRFVRTCDAFNIPIVTLVDVPGFLPGTGQEHSGIIRRGAGLLHAFCEATVPRVQVILRKAYGGAYIVMNSKSVGADLAFAWPTAEVAVMGADAAVRIAFKRVVDSATNPRALEAELVANYEQAFKTPLGAAERGYIDDIIDPADTRAVLIKSFDMLRSKRETFAARKHSNHPV